MSDQYLWDGTGPPDPEVERLERLLSGFQYRRKARLKRLTIFAILAAAACVVLVSAVMLWRPGKPLSQWQSAGKRIAIGATIETTGGGVKLEAPSFGEVSLDANSRLQILPSTEGNERLALRRGTLHAFIWAPPAKFLVDTPSANAVDLGCSYTLTVLADDSAMLTVQTGWVAFQNGATESFIPAGAACRTRPKLGPGLPYFETASRELRDAVARFDATAGAEGLTGIVSNAQQRDALTLWHLIVRTSGADRELAIERFASLVPGVDSAGLRAGDRNAIDHAWNALGLGETAWWRTWKRTWQPPKAKG